jgi:hypothetical protein
MEAARKGYSQIVDDLIKAGADPRPFDQKGLNALWFAIDGNHMEIVSKLLKAGVKPSDTSWTRKESHVQRAWDLGNDEIVDILIENGATFDTIDRNNGKSIFEGGNKIIDACLGYISAIHKADPELLRQYIPKNRDRRWFEGRKDWSDLQGPRLVRYTVTDGFYNDKIACLTMEGTSVYGKPASWSYRLVFENSRWLVDRERWNTGNELQKKMRKQDAEMIRKGN